MASINEKKRVACFFTAGYTELNAMKAFMRKINDKVEYIQLCPCGTRRSKDSIRNRHKDNIDIDQNGLTGAALINFIVDFVEKKRFKEEEYDAILIEDDKDERFLCKQQDGSGVMDEIAWKQFKDDVKSRLYKECPGIPIIFFYAAPEVEAWFWSDFDHSFGSVYNSVFSATQYAYFRVRFRKYVNDNILTSRYRDCIEQYGYFGGQYRKLSKQIQDALSELDFLAEYDSEEVHPTISYSKRTNGEDMLRQIDPLVVLRNCDWCFKEGFLALQEI